MTFRGPTALTFLAVSIVVTGGAWLAVTAASGSAGSSGRAGGAPELEQLTYEESNDGTSRRYNLSAFARRADSVSFAVRKNHDRIAAPAKFNKSVTDTDLPNGPVSHPWEIVRQGGGAKVLRQIRRSLNRRGAIPIRIRMRGNGGVSKDKVTVVAAACGSDPPLYPLTCEIRR